MKRLIVGTLFIALFLIGIFVATANADLTAGSSSGQVIALDDDPNLPE